MKNYKQLLILFTLLIGGFIPNQAYAQANAKISDSVPIAEHFEGGKEALMKTIQETMEYPPAAKKNRRQGTCIIRLELLEDGTTKNLKIVKEFGSGSGAEAKRIVETLKFNAPGYSGIYSIPVKFKL